MTDTSGAPRIAIACSGLGHIQRGIESWAADLARALQRAGSDTTLFGGAPGPGIVALPCLRRTGPAAVAIARVLRHLGGWRYGCGSPYELEQTSFALPLWRRIQHRFDILHVQDPAIALCLEAARRRGLSRAKVIYANGTGEGTEVMRRFAHLQLLTNEARDAWMPARPPGQSVFTIPNFIDTDRFSPGDQVRARQSLGLPAEGLIVLCCAAIRRFHKRIDYLLDEFASVASALPPDTVLVIAGGREDDTDSLIAAGTQRLGNRVRFLPDLPRARMPELYRAADLFTLASLHEMFGIVLLEAMATGLPVLCHDAPGFRRVVGPGGLYRDLSAAGGLAGGLMALCDPATRVALSSAARAHVVRHYAEDVVVPDIIAMYGAVLHG